MIVDILVIVLSTLFVLINLGNYIYKKIKKIPTDTCGSCSTKGATLLENYNKKYK